MLPDDGRDREDNEGDRGRTEKRLRLFDRLFLKLFGGGLGASPVTSADKGDNDRSDDSRRASSSAIPRDKCGFSFSHWSNLAVSIFSAGGVFEGGGASTTVTAGTPLSGFSGEDGGMSTSCTAGNAGEGGFGED